MAMIMPYHQVLDLYKIKQRESILPNGKKTDFAGTPAKQHLYTGQTTSRYSGQTTLTTKNTKEFTKNTRLMMLQGDIAHLPSNLNFLQSNLNHLRSNFNHLRSNFNLLRSNLNFLRSNLNLLRSNLNLLQSNLNFLISNDFCDGKIHSGVPTHDENRPPPCFLRATESLGRHRALLK